MDGVGRGGRPSSTATTRSWPMWRRARRRLRQDRRPAGRARGQDRGRRRRRSLDRHDRDRHGRPAAARPATPTCRRCRAARSAAWRCAACCCSRPDLLLLDEPTNHLDAESVDVARAVPAALPRAPSWRSPTTGTSSTTSPSGSSSSSAARASRSRATTPAGSRRSRRSWPSRRSRSRPGRRPSSASSSGSAWPPKARQAKGKARLAGLRASCRPRPTRPSSARPKLQIQLPNGRRLGGVVIEANGRVARASATACSSRTSRSSCRPRASSASSARTAPARPRLFRMITGQEPPDGGTFKIGDTVDLAYVDQSRDSLVGDATASTRRSPAAPSS